VSTACLILQSLASKLALLYREKEERLAFLVNWVLFFLDLTDLFFSLFSYLPLFSLFFSLIFTTWRGETFIVVVRCQPLSPAVSFYISSGVKETHTQTQKESETKREPASDSILYRTG
jgi:hypothetical protein